MPHVEQVGFQKMFAIVSFVLLVYWLLMQVTLSSKMGSKVCEYIRKHMTKFMIVVRA